MKVQPGHSALHGLGVFAPAGAVAGEVLEECPVVVVPESQVDALDGTVLFDYYFAWPGGDAAIALGYGSLYNHSFSANARYDIDAERRLVVITAREDITPGAEVTINYVGDPEARSALWFDPAPED